MSAHGRGEVPGGVPAGVHVSACPPWEALLASLDGLEARRWGESGLDSSEGPSEGGRMRQETGKGKLGSAWGQGGAGRGWGVGFTREGVCEGRWGKVGRNQSSS